MRLTGDDSYNESSVLREADRGVGRDTYSKFVTLQWAAFSPPVTPDLS